MNDRLRKCPRCGKGECEHAELRVANLLAKVGSGVMNIDVNARSMWVASLGKRNSGSCGRTAFIELKRSGERPLSGGGFYTYRDITGTLTTSRGDRFDQRGFVIHEQPDGTWTLSTFNGPYQTTSALQLEDSASIIHEWILHGTLPADHAEGPAA